MFTKFKLFVESRFQYIFKSDDDEFDSYRIDFDCSGEFIKFFSIRLGKEKKRFKLIYHHTETHNLKQRVNDRTSLKSINEFNYLFIESLKELFKENYTEVQNNGSYSLYLKEYNFSIILNINYILNNIFVKTVKQGMETVNVKNIIEIKTTL